MTKTYYLLLLLLLTLNGIFAQDYEFGKISEEELALKNHKLDSSAVASVLYEKQNSTIEYKDGLGFVLVTYIQKRVKIFDEKGFGYGVAKVYLYIGGTDEENLSSLRGYTYNLEDGKIKESKLSRDAIFKNDESRYWKSQTFTFPDIKEGSIIEYKYTITSPYVSNIQTVNIQKEVPVDFIEATYEFPEYYYFKPVVKGYLDIGLKTSSGSESVNYMNKQRSGGTSAYDQVRTSYQSGKIDYLVNISSISLTDIPSMKDEPFVNNIDNYRASLDYELSYIKYPNSSIESYSTTWEDVTKKIYEDPDFGTELKKTGYFEDEIDQLINQTSNVKDKMALVFEFVKNKMSWNGVYGYTCNDGVRNAYKDNTGNVAEINLMFTAMLQYSGIEAYPVLVSTRSNGIPLFPTREGFNYVITAAVVGEDVILLDATSKYSKPNLLPTRALNWNGRLIKKGGESLKVDLAPHTISNEMVFMNVELNDDGSVKGKVRGQYLDYNAYNYRVKNDQKSKDDLIKSIEDTYLGVEIDEYEVKNQYDVNKPLIEQYSFYKENAYDQIADKIYVSPLFFFTQLENPFKLEKREFPIDFSYPHKEKYAINIAIPEGYKVESLPESTKLVLPDGIGSFSYMAGTSTGNLQLSVELEISSAIVPSLYYDSIKQYFSKIIEKESEKVVLSQS